MVCKHASFSNANNNAVQTARGTLRAPPLSSVAALASPTPLSSVLRGAHFAPPSALEDRAASDASQVVFRPRSLFFVRASSGRLLPHLLLLDRQHDNVYLSAVVLRVKTSHTPCLPSILLP